MTSKIDIEVWVADLNFPGWMDRWHATAAEFSRLHPEYLVTVRGMNFFGFPHEVADDIAAGHGKPALAEYYFYASQVARDAVDADGAPLWTSVTKAVGDRIESMSPLTV